MLNAILYASEATCEFSESDLNLLLKQANKKNLIMEVTGYLYFENGRFLQYIEGNSFALESLYSKIQRDERHKIFRRILDEDLPERRFPTWSMCWFQTKELPSLKIETLLIDQLEILSRTTQNAPDFKTTTMHLVETLAGHQNLLANRQPG